jgi:hypothetical protein
MRPAVIIREVASECVKLTAKNILVETHFEVLSQRSIDLAYLAPDLESSIRYQLNNTTKPAFAPKSQALIDNFVDQWLQIRNLKNRQPNSHEFPDFDDNLRQAFRRETELFFAYIMRENRSALELLSADYTFLNERLAKHYGIDGVRGPEMRKVELSDPRRDQWECFSGTQTRLAARAGAGGIDRRGGEAGPVVVADGKSAVGCYVKRARQRHVRNTCRRGASTASRGRPPGRTTP